MVAIRSVEKISTKYVDRASTAGPQYEAGVRDPLKDWAAETGASEPSYNKGVQDGIGRKAFSKGVKETGTGEWQDKAIKKGVGRFPEGVRVAGPDYTEGFTKAHDTIAALTLPERRPKGDPANIQRVAVITSALRKSKTG